jgi:hypothetical protein
MPRKWNVMHDCLIDNVEKHCRVKFPAFVWVEHLYRVPEGLLKKRRCEAVIYIYEAFGRLHSHLGVDIPVILPLKLKAEMSELSILL